MNELETAIQQALQAEGASQPANKAYLELIKSNVIIPIEKNSAPEAPEVLYLLEQGMRFLPVFSNRDILDEWARPIHDQIQVLHLSGVDLLKGIGDDITVSLNIGSPLYKEFNPAELARMKSMVLKIWPK